MLKPPWNHNASSYRVDGFHSRQDVQFIGVTKGVL